MRSDIHPMEYCRMTDPTKKRPLQKSKSARPAARPQRRKQMPWPKCAEKTPPNRNIPTQPAAKKNRPVSVGSSVLVVLQTQGVGLIDSKIGVTADAYQNGPRRNPNKKAQSPTGPPWSSNALGDYDAKRLPARSYTKTTPDQRIFVGRGVI